MSNFWHNVKTIFQANSGGLSSKRVCGVFGWIACVGVLIYCTILAIQAPVFADAVLFATAGLLGIDSVTSIWKNQIVRNETNTEENS